MNLNIMLAEEARYKNVHIWKCQKVQTSSYKINTRDVKYSMMTINKTAVWYRGNLLRE